MAGARLQGLVIGKHAQEDHRARDRDGEAEDQPRSGAPAEPVRDERPGRGGHGDLQECAGQGNAPNGEQLFDAKVEAYAEHQENDPDLGELLGNLGVRNESRREGADGDSRNQIADDGRQTKPLRGEAEDDRGRERARERENEIEVGRHRASLAGPKGMSNSRSRVGRLRSHLLTRSGMKRSRWAPALGRGSPCEGLAFENRTRSGSAV